jgi:hypothetical protein
MPSGWSTLRRNKTVGTPAFRRAFEKTALSRHDLWLKETQRQRSEEQESERPRFTLVEKPRCQTLRSHVRSATLRSCLRNASRNTTGNVTLRTRSVVSHVATHGEQASVVRKYKEEVSANDSRSPAISAARAIQCHLSHQLAGRSCAAIVLARAERNKDTKLAQA